MGYFTYLLLCVKNLTKVPKSLETGDHEAAKLMQGAMVITLWY